MLDDEMKVVTHTGTILGGAQAICHLAGKVWWASPLALLWHLHFPRPLLRKLYRHIADRRHCKNGNCSLRPPTHNRGSLTRVFNCL
jgi:predicted DCC family thiol-disulfide oxidoreductase YuxK